MTVPDRQRFWKWRVQWLAVRPFGRIPKKTYACQRVSTLRSRVLHIEQNGRLLYIKTVRLHGPDIVDTHSRHLATHLLIFVGFSRMHILDRKSTRLHSS